MIPPAEVDAGPGGERSWAEVPMLHDTVGWVEVEENGWGCLRAWSAGSGRVARMPQDDASRCVRVSCETGGVITSWDEQFSPVDRAGIEDSINTYLALAGVLPRPVGFTWFLRLPDGWPTGRDFCEDFDAIAQAGPAPARDSEMPKVLAVMREAVRALYG